MSTYQGIRGLKVRDYTTNPDDPLEGQLWYNKTDQVGKYQIPNLLASWRTSIPINTARASQGQSSSQSATSALVFGGDDPSGKVALSESWNGSTWSETNDLTTARAGGAGSGESSTSALLATGETSTANVANVETWNGTSWVETTDVGTARRLCARAGTATQALVAGGYTSTDVNNTEIWNVGS